VYTGIIDSYSEFRTIQYVAGAVVGAVSNHSVSAHLQGYNTSCMSWGIGNGAWVGNGMAPAGYPDYRDAACTSGGSGHYGDFRDLTISVQGCAVATEQSTWGNVKDIYRK